MEAFTLCFTGISGSGKSTLAKKLEAYLKKKSYHCSLIDGDQLRNELGQLFGYTKEERMKNSQIVRVLAKYLKNQGVVNIISIVAPYEKMRQDLRKFIGEPYIEVFVDCSYDTCAQRDVKGYYKKQKDGLLNNLNGADDVYETPANSDIVVQTDKETIEESLKKIVDFLENHHYVV